MTAKQYRGILDRLGLNQQEAGRLFGVSRRTAQNWAAYGPPEPVGRLLALVIRHGISLEELDE